MPTTYHFVTTLRLPTSDDFPCLDMDQSSMPAILYFPNIALSRGAPWIEVDSENNLAVTSGDGVLSYIQGSLPIESSFTFETTFRPQDLPEDLHELDKTRFFIGVYDQQGICAGVLLSKSGLALMSYFSTAAMVLPGSQHLLEEGSDYYTLRIVVDSEQGSYTLYLTKTDDLATIGHQLRYTSSPASTPVGVPDCFRIDVLGKPTNAVQIDFATFRCSCTEPVVPNQRPIADPGADQTANIGSAVIHNGEASYDPEGQPLSYSWALISAPEGSRFRITGLGQPVDDGDSDDFTDIFSGGPEAFNSDNAPLLQPYDHLVIEGTVYQLSDYGWLWNESTGKYDRDVGGTWDDDQVVITKDTLPLDLGEVGWSILHTATYFNDRTFPAPVAIPDKSGLYEVQLVVNDGQLDSLPATSLLNVSQTSVALGCIPDVSWVWNLLSDFWNLLEDREIVETVWSGFAQAAAAQLMTAWQFDYNKSLLDIQRVFQRRWLSYDTSVDDDSETAAIRIIRGPIVSGDLSAGAAVSGKTLQLVLDAGQVQTVTFTGADPLSVDDLADQINAQMGFSSLVTKLAKKVVRGTAEYLSLEYATLLRVRPAGTANADLGFSTADYMQNDLQGGHGQATAAGSVKYEILEPQAVDLQVEGITSDDLLVRNGASYRIQKVALKSVIPPAVPSEYRALSLVDEVEDAVDTSWLIPSSVLSQTLNFVDLVVQSGDIARFELKDLSTGKFSEVDCEVIGVQQDRIGFDPKPLLEFYNGSPSNYRTLFLGVKRTAFIPVDDLVVEIPRLQEIIKDPPVVLQENTDFQIKKVGDKNTISFTSGTFSYLNPPPDRLWAEITYLDNRPTVEANFGHLVNFKVADMENMSSDLDYLSAVRGLWWTYFGGPALSKVRTGVQILLGLPFSEADGVVTSVDPTFSSTEGRVVIQDKVNTSIVRTYFYPKVAGLGINPDTNVAYAEGDSVSIFAPLCGGIEVADYKSTARWMEKYVYQGQFLELQKFFWFMVRADVDTFSMANLVFALDFVKKIRPHYTYPLFIMLKRLPVVEVNELDQVLLKPRLFLSDSFCSVNTPASYRWDDTDESGHWNYNYDDPTPPPQFLFDTHRLCPSEVKWVHIYYIHPGVGGWYYDTIWAYDDGGGNDKLALSGPDSSPPAPYGPLVGVIHYDATVVGGTYHRIRYF